MIHKVLSTMIHPYPRRNTALRFVCPVLALPYSSTLINTAFNHFRALRSFEPTMKSSRLKRTTRTKSISKIGMFGILTLKLQLLISCRAYWLTLMNQVGVKDFGEGLYLTKIQRWLGLRLDILGILLVSFTPSLHHRRFLCSLIFLTSNRCISFRAHCGALY